MNQQQYMPDLPLYHSIDPRDFRVGHRYCVAPGHEHEYTVARVSLIGDRVLVERFNGSQMSYPLDQLAFICCDEMGC